MHALISGGEQFHGFEGMSLAVLILAGGAAILWAMIFAWRWFATFPYQPAPGPTTSDTGDEPPAIVNLLVHRCALTRAAIPATVLDLAARGALAVEQYGRQVVVRVREHRIQGMALAAYEGHLLDHIRRHATGGSAPIEALGFDSPDEANRFWDRFRKAVVAEARQRRLVRNRWAPRDWTILGGFLAAALGLAAFALGLAHFAEENTGSSDDWGRWDWFWVAGISWAVIMAGLGALRDLRDTPTGRAAAARWLGVRTYLRQAEAFEDAPPAAVTVWDRYLAYGAALGVAHEAVRAMPFDDEDPASAWTRYGGHWREIDIRYPARFSFGKPPFRVFLEGAARAGAWGFAGFYMLPIAVRFLLDATPELLNGEQFENSGGVRVFIAIMAATVAVIGVVCALHFLGGVIRLWRGAADLGRPSVLEGEVVKLYNGRVAVDDGTLEEATAWTPPLGAPGLRRGARVRVTHTPRLWYVSRVEVLEAAPELPATAVATAGDPPEPEAVLPLATAIGGAIGILRAASGLALQPADAARAGPMTRRPMGDGAGRGITVSRMPLEGIAAKGAAALITRSAAEHGEPVEGLGTNAWWMSGHALIVCMPGEIVTIEAAVQGGDADARREAAITAARELLGTK